MRPELRIFIAGIIAIVILSCAVNASAFDSNTTSVISFDGTNGGTLFPDSVNGNIWTPTGNAQTVTTPHLFGNASGYMAKNDGTAGYITSNNTTFANFGTGNYTIEGALNLTSVYTSGYGMLTCNASAESQFIAVYDNTGSGNMGKIRVYNGTAQVALSTINLTANRWWNWSVVRAGNTVTIYIEGLANGTGYDNSNVLYGGANIGRDPTSANFGFRGYLDNMRFSNVARYTSNYTIQSTPWGTVDTNSTISLLPNPQTITVGNSANVTLYANETYATPYVIVANISYNSSSVNATNVYLNNTVLSGTTLATTFKSGYVLINVSNSSGMAITGNTPIADIKFNALNATNVTEPLNFASAYYNISSGASTNFPITNPGQLNILVAPVANFTTNVSYTVEPGAVAFTDTSSGVPTSWNWSFGPGDLSTLQNPTYTYWSGGNYTVTLNVTNSVGTNITTKYFNVYNATTAAWTANTTASIVPFTVAFTDTSTNTTPSPSYYWDFGDGNTSTLQNPTNTYVNAGTYTVKHKISNGFNTSWLNTSTITGYTNPQGVWIYNSSGKYWSFLNSTLTTIKVNTSLSASWPAPQYLLNNTLSNAFIYGGGGNGGNGAGGVYGTSTNGFGGTGGQASTVKNVVGYTITGGSSYPLVVGGANASSTAFGNTSAGAPNGIIGGTGTFNGGAGTSDYTGSVPYVNGTAGTNGNYGAYPGGTGGAGGSGFGAGGGGGGGGPWQGSGTGYGTGGAGANGYVEFTYNNTQYLLPNASFTYTPLSGVAPVTVNFTDTSNGPPTSWSWSYIQYVNGVYYSGPTTFSTSQNPSQSFGLSTMTFEYKISLTATNVVGSNVSTQVSWVNTTQNVGNAAFSYSPTISNVPVNVTVVDSSTATPAYINWSWGDSTWTNGTYAATSTTTHQYTSPGNKTITEYPFDASFNPFITTSHVFTATIGVPYASFTASPTSGTAGVLVTFTDTSVRGTSANLTYNWSFNDLSGTQPYSNTTGSVSHVYQYNGLFTPTLTISNDNGTSTFTGSQIVVSQSQSSTWYTPLQTTIVVADQYGNAIPGATINATYNRTSLPGGVNDLINFYGMSSAAANQVMNTQLILNGVTDSNGRIIFTMATGITYNTLIIYNGTTYSYTIAPSTVDNYYQIRLPQTTQDSLYNDIYAAGNTWTKLTAPDPGNLTFMWSYQDVSPYTTNISYYLMCTDNNTMIYQTYQANPIQYGVYQLNFTIQNVRGQNYIFWENYTRSI